ncbi:hypothetical protein ES705_34468 [subsurface metagenome]
MDLPKLPKIFKQRTLLESRQIPTPFGHIETPRIETPPLEFPSLEDRHRKALGHTIGIDASDILGIIPYVGGNLADSIRAMHTREVKKLLTPEEYNNYMLFDKTYPDFLALIRSRLP